jgi:hypothetical protein
MALKVCVCVSDFPRTKSKFHYVSLPFPQFIHVRARATSKKTSIYYYTIGICDPSCTSIMLASSLAGVFVLKCVGELANPCKCGDCRKCA